jgi:hypothetical protein
MKLHADDAGGVPDVLLEYKGLRRWYIAPRITGFLGFVHGPVL